MAVGVGSGPWGKVERGMARLKAAGQVGVSGSGLQEAILRTLLYADVFDFPLTPQEIGRYLIGQGVAPELVHRELEAGSGLGGRIVRVNGYVALRDRARLAGRREAREDASSALWRAARVWGRWNGCLPFVRMVAVTGALAMNNSDPGDDIDLLIVTRPGRVWLARAFAILLVRLARLTGVALCPNYLLAETSLKQSRQDLFAAHELAQMVPVVGLEVHRRMIAANPWASSFLPNAFNPPKAGPDLRPGAGLRCLQASLEWLLGGRLGDWLERWERRRKTRKFSAEASKPGAAAILDAEHVKGHFDDYGHRALKAYRERLEREGIEGEV